MTSFVAIMECSGNIAHRSTYFLEATGGSHTGSIVISSPLISNRIQRVDTGWVQGDIQ